MQSLILILFAWALDRLLGEPTKHHPLVYLGDWIKALEQRLYQNRRLAGVWAYAWVMLPCVALALLAELYLPPILYWPLALVLVYLAMAYRSLIEHVERIRQPLLAEDLVQARQQLSYIVSRDTSSANNHQVAQGTIESLLENGCDAIFGAWFWFVIAGLPGLVMYRIANTFDAMWGYKNSRFLHFGWFAARFDDVLNFIPARITALAYGLAGNFKPAWQAWQQQGLNWKSPNAGPVMAAGAASLGLRLGGAAVYHGQQQTRPQLGFGRLPQAPDISRAIHLLNKACFWVLLQLAVLAFAMSLLANYMGF